MIWECHVSVCVSSLAVGIGRISKAWGESVRGVSVVVFFFNDTATTEIYTLSLHDALPIYLSGAGYIIKL